MKTEEIKQIEQIVMNYNDLFYKNGINAELSYRHFFAWEDYLSIDLQIEEDDMLIEVLLWSSVDEQREFNEEVNDYEPMDLFIGKQINKFIDITEQFKESINEDYG
jgi:sugar diacid utilization regulator